MTSTLASRNGHDIDSTMLDSIDASFTNLFGPYVTQAFYVYFKEKFGLTRESMVSQLDRFLSAIHETFGVDQERAVARVFYTNLGLQFNDRWNYTLLEYLNEAKRTLGRQAVENHGHTKVQKFNPYHRLTPRNCTIQPDPTHEPLG